MLLSSKESSGIAMIAPDQVQNAKVDLRLSGFNLTGFVGSAAMCEDQNLHSGASCEQQRCNEFRVFLAWLLWLCTHTRTHTVALENRQSHTCRDQLQLYVLAQDRTVEVRFLSYVQYHK